MKKMLFITIGLHCVLHGMQSGVPLPVMGNNGQGVQAAQVIAPIATLNTNQKLRSEMLKMIAKSESLNTQIKQVFFIASVLWLMSFGMPDDISMYGVYSGCFFLFCFIESGRLFSEKIDYGMVKKIFQ